MPTAALTPFSYTRTAAALLISVGYATHAHAQAGPFASGATALQTNLLTILAPVAVIAVMALGVAAWFNRISWGWMVGGVAGIVLVFGASQVVTWVRGLFGV